MRPPDLIVGSKADPQMYRWHLIRWRGWQLSLHKWFRSDDDRALHDHRADSLSFILRGRYVEFPGYWGHGTVYGAGSFIFRKAETPHRIVLNLDSVVWTLWLRWPPRREWGFHCPKGWKHWRAYLAQDYNQPGSESTKGKGCDE